VGSRSPSWRRRRRSSTPIRRARSSRGAIFEQAGGEWVRRRSRFQARPWRPYEKRKDEVLAAKEFQEFVARPPAQRSTRRSRLKRFGGDRKRRPEQLDPGDRLGRAAPEGLSGRFRRPCRKACHAGLLAAAYERSAPLFSDAPVACVVRAVRRRAGPKNPKAPDQLFTRRSGAKGAWRRRRKRWPTGAAYTSKR